MDKKKIDELLKKLPLLKQEIQKRIIGQDETIEQLLIAFIAGGHALLEGVPGLAKTLMIRTLAEAVDVQFKRIQFTPDLMPTDIIGTEVLQSDQQTGERMFQFKPGPIFANIILADEINRTPPKTQSALLQAMQEQEVTVSGRTYALDPPFFVLATQNPIEQEGTYSLPEAALDRFMFMVLIQYPKRNDEYRIVKKTTIGTTEAVQAVLSQKDITLFQKIVRTAPVSDRIIKYCVDLARASRPEDELAPEIVQKYLKWGSGPRAGQFMTLGAKAMALIQNRITPSYQDVVAVSKLVLRHRIILNFNAEADGVTTDEIIEGIVEAVDRPK